ncbi:MAG: AAA family ATPase [Actinomycetota bacterium]|nr:AAA family ATPase [Actinomycetota bacterium]
MNARALRVLVTDVELRAALAERGYSLGVDGEVDQARGAVELLSKRSRTLGVARGRLEVSWRAAHSGREPSRRTVSGWDRQAWEETRPAKPLERETPGQVAERVRVELAAAGFDFTPGRLVVDEPARAVPVTVSVGGVDRDALAAEAVSALGAAQSAWSDAELTAGVEAAVTRAGVVGDPQAVSELVEDVRARAVERCASILDPEIGVPSSMSRYWTSPAVIDADLALNVGLAGLVGELGGRDREAGRAGAAGGLDDGQVEALEAVCGTRGLEVVIGPAGTGKTRMLAVARECLDAQGREMVVVAPTRKAAQVAAVEVGGVEGVSLSKLLYEHGWRWDGQGRWSRLAPGQVDPVTGAACRGPGESLRLGPHSVVVVDEAGLVTVDQANALVDVLAGSGGMLRLVGDPRQLGAVGRGGVMETAARWCPGPVSMDQVHRFLTVGADEAGMPVTGPDVDYAELSKELRDGLEADRVVERFAQRGAVVVHETEAGAVAAIAVQVAADAGKQGALAVTVATNEAARALNDAVRALRVGSGQVDDTRVAAGIDGQRIGAGDQVITRRNNTALGVANRETWRVETVTGDRSVVACGSGGRRVHLDPGYVATAVELGYAVTDYGNQGVTADASITWVSDATSAGGLYVGATRGRYANQLHVVAADALDAHQRVVAAIGRDRADRGLDAARQAAQLAACNIPPQPPPPPLPASLSQPRSAPATPAGVLAANQASAIPPGWCSQLEVDRAETALRARYARRLDALVDRKVMTGEVRGQQDRLDRERAGSARSEARAHRDAARQARAGRDELIGAASAAMFAARDAARVIDAGPGFLARRAGQVEAARALRQQTAATWGEASLPGVGVSDDHLRRAGSEMAGAVIDAQVGYHETEAARCEQAAADADWRLETRERAQHAARATNRSHAQDRERLTVELEAGLARIDAARQARATYTQTMTPQQVEAFDRARDHWLAEHPRVRQPDLVSGRPGPGDSPGLGLGDGPVPEPDSPDLGLGL